MVVRAGQPALPLSWQGVESLVRGPEHGERVVDGQLEHRQQPRVLNREQTGGMTECRNNINKSNTKIIHIQTRCVFDCTGQSKRNNGSLLERKLITKDKYFCHEGHPAVELSVCAAESSGRGFIVFLCRCSLPLVSPGGVSADQRCVGVTRRNTTQHDRKCTACIKYLKVVCYFYTIP